MKRNNASGTGSGFQRGLQPEIVTNNNAANDITTVTKINLVTNGLGSFIDLIDDGTSANGNAVLRIRYSDGGEGTLGIGCEGPGPGIGIVEGVIATKDHVTYWDAQAPVAGVDANRTLFHVR